MSNSFRKIPISHSHTNSLKKKAKKRTNRSRRVVKKNILSFKDSELINELGVEFKKRSKESFQEDEYDSYPSITTPVFNGRMYPENDYFNVWDERISGKKVSNYHYSGLPLNKKEQQRENYKRITK